MRVLACGMMLFGFLAGPAAAQDVPANIPANVAACARCHGAGGNTAPGAPRLNGQQKQYLIKRFGEFEDPMGQSPHGTISPADRAAIAQYFSAEPPTPAKPGALAAEGRRIYDNGAGPRVIACRQCHGAAGEGHDAVPRLAGQHRDYLDGQLAFFAIQLRDNKLMHTNTSRMTTKEMEAVASFLGSD